MNVIATAKIIAVRTRPRLDPSASRTRMLDLLLWCGRRRRAGHCGPAECERPGAWRERQPDAGKQQPQLSEGHQQSVPPRNTATASLRQPRIAKLAGSRPWRLARLAGEGKRVRAADSDLPTRKTIGLSLHRVPPPTTEGSDIIARKNSS